MTKQIQLTKGYVTSVSDVDFAYLSQWRWHANIQKGKVYAVRGEGTWPLKELIRMHRQIMDAPIDLQVDHINGNTLGNRRENLRLCTRSENGRNQKLRPDNTTGFKGVRRKGSKFVAYIMVHQKQIYLGAFRTAEDAARAYDKKAKELHGEFARLNF